MFLEVPVWTDFVGLEADRWAGGEGVVDLDGFVLRVDALLLDTVFVPCAVVYLYWFGTTVHVEVFVKSDLRPAIVSEEVAAVFWVVAFAKLVVRFGELLGMELDDPWFGGVFLFAFYMASAPAWIDQFPGSVVDADGIPGVTVGLQRWSGGIVTVSYGNLLDRAREE